MQAVELLVKICVCLPQLSTHINDLLLFCLISYDKVRTGDIFITITDSSNKYDCCQAQVSLVPVLLILQTVKGEGTPD